MSDSQIQEVKYPLDMTQKEKEELKRFQDDGLPGIAQALTKERVETAISMYLSGSSYTEISQVLSIKRSMVLYMAHLHNFYDMKLDFYQNLVSQIKDKTEIASIRGLDFLTDLMGSIEDYYRDILKKYKISKDKRIMDSADFENVKLYMKCLEYVKDFNKPPGDKDKKGSQLGLQVPQGATLRKIDDNTLEVTTSQTSQVVENKLGEVLEHLAKLRELREKQ